MEGNAVLSTTDTVEWIGNDHTMDLSNPLHSKWKLKFIDSPQSALSFVALFNFHIVLSNKNEQELVEEITCCICFDFISSASLLHCGHIGCKQCMQEWIESSKSSQDGSSCPKCRALVEYEPIACHTIDHIIKSQKEAMDEIIVYEVQIKAVYRWDEDEHGMPCWKKRAIDTKLQFIKSTSDGKERLIARDTKTHKLKMNQIDNELCRSSLQIKSKKSVSWMARDSVLKKEYGKNERVEFVARFHSECDAMAFCKYFCPKQHDDIESQISELSKWPESEIQIGDRVKTKSGKYGKVKFIGRVSNCLEDMFGLELDRMVFPGNDGSFNGVKYFDVPSHRGYFTMRHDLNKIEQDDEKFLDDQNKHSVIVTNLAMDTGSDDLFQWLESVQLQSILNVNVSGRIGLVRSCIFNLSLFIVQLLQLTLLMIRLIVPT